MNTGNADVDFNLNLYNICDLQTEKNDSRSSNLKPNIIFYYSSIL